MKLQVPNAPRDVWWNEPISSPDDYYRTKEYFGDPFSPMWGRDGIEERDLEEELRAMAAKQFHLYGRYIDQEPTSWNEYLCHVRYKPKYVIVAFEQSGLQWMRAMTICHDRDNHRRKVIIQNNQIVPFFDKCDEKERRLTVRNLLKQLEDHEVDEMLLFDGVRVFDPHA